MPRADRASTQKRKPGAKKRPALTWQDKRPATAELGALIEHYNSQPEITFDGMKFRRTFLDGCSEFELLRVPDLSSYLESVDRDAYARMFDQIAWVGRHAEGVAVGYWHGGKPTLTGAPVVVLDGELRVSAMSLIDHLAAMAHDRRTVADFAKTHGLAAPRSESAVRTSIKKVPDPAKELAAAKGRDTLVRPLSRHPLAAPLPDGRALIVAIDDEASSPKDPFRELTFIFDGKQFSLGAEMPDVGHDAILTTADGRVVVVGTRTGETQIAIFDSETATWKATPKLDQTFDQAAIVLAGERVVLAGGCVYGFARKFVAVYDLAKRAWAKGLSELSIARRNPAGVALDDGRVLIIGGEDASWLKSCEVFDRTTKKSSEVAPLPKALFYPHARKLPDGRIWVGDHENTYCIYDPKRDAWTSRIKDDSLEPPYLALRDGRIAAFGSKIRVFDPRSNKTSSGGTLVVKRSSASAVRLGDGRVLVLGGMTGDGHHAGEPEIWDPAARASTPIPGLEKRLREQARR